MKKRKLSQSSYFVFTKKHLYFFLFLIIVFIVYYLILHSSVVAIKKIDCRLDYQPCKDPYLLQELHKYYQTNILTLDVYALQNKLITSYPTFDKVIITKKLPHLLYVRIFSTKPVIALKIKNQQTWLLYDNHLRGIAVVHTQPQLAYLIVPQVEFIYGQPPHPSNLTKQLAFALKIANQLPQAQRMLVSDHTFYVRLDNSLLAVFDMSKQLNPQLTLLIKILKNPALLEHNKTKTIDVRFSQAVLKPYFALLF